MPWKEVNVLDQKLEFVIRAFTKQETFTELCREYGISTKTGYKWRARFLEEGLDGLYDISRRPIKSSKTIAEDIVCDIVKIKTLKSKLGPKKIQQVYADAHPKQENPSLSSVKRILSKAGLVKKKKRRKKKTDNGRIQNRFIPEKPNDLWTVDFKGWWYTPNREKCEPLTVRDEFSKYILSIALLEKGDILSVKKEFERLFCEYGLPGVIRSDNGPPFASSQSMLGLTKLAVWWLSLGIKLDRIDPGSPYQNGAHERMHLDMKRELQGQINGDLNVHQSVFNVWRNEFNRERPHEALQMKTPGSVYRKSKRKYELFNGYYYPHGFMERRINDRGWVNYRGHRIFISNAFAGYTIGIDESKGDIADVWFDENLIGNIYRRDFLFTPATALNNI